MIAFRAASRFGSIFISGRFDCRLDEPAATRSRRIFTRGKSRPSRADRQPTHTIHCGSALPPCRESEKAQPEDPRAGGDNRESGNPIGMASEIDRQEIRWQRVQNSRAATNRDGDFGTRCPYGRGKPRVGLSADSGCIIESRPRSGPHHNCRHPETSWHRPSTGEKSENDLEGVSHSTLGSDRCNRFLHRGGVDLFGIDTFRHPNSSWMCRHGGWKLAASPL